MDSALGDFIINVIVSNIVALSPNIEDKIFLGGGFQVDKKSKTAYLNDNYTLLILQITAKMSVFFSLNSLVG